MIANLTIGRTIDFAIETERVGQEVYQRLATAHAGNADLRDLFRRLAEDEKLHESQLAEFRRNLESTGERELPKDDSDYLRSISWLEVFHGDRDPIAAADRVESPRDALEMAHNLERSTLLYYGAIRDLLGEDPILQGIIDMEKHHLKQVIKYLMDPEIKMRGVTDQWT